MPSETLQTNLSDEIHVSVEASGPTDFTSLISEEGRSNLMQQVLVLSLIVLN